MDASFINHILDDFPKRKVLGFVEMFRLIKSHLFSIQDRELNIRPMPRVVLSNKMLMEKWGHFRRLLEPGVFLPVRDDIFCEMRIPGVKPNLTLFSVFLPVLA